MADQLADLPHQGEFVNRRALSRADITVCVPAPPGVFLPALPCVSRLPPVSFYQPAGKKAPPGVFLPAGW